MLLKLELFSAVSAKLDTNLTPLSAQSLTTFNLCPMVFEMRYVSLVFHSSTGSSKKDASMLRRLEKHQESGPIKDARIIVVLRTENIGFPNVRPCLFIGKDVRLCSHTFLLDTTAFLSMSLTLSFNSEIGTYSSHKYQRCRMKVVWQHQQFFDLSFCRYEVS